MKHNDEFNVERITNVDDIGNFEFGNTPINETPTQVENDDSLNDEVNDGNETNNENKSPERESKKQESKENLREQKEDTSSKSNSGGSSGGSGGGSAASGGASAASSATAVVGAASTVAVAVAGVAIGFNMFVNGRIQNEVFDITEEAITYQMELVETNEDNFIIILENKDLEYREEREMFEGPNEGTFELLSSNTKYHLAVLNTSSYDYAIYEKDIVTLGGGGGDVPVPVDIVKISFTAEHASGFMDEINASVGSIIQLPSPTFTPEEHYMFSYYYDSFEPEKHYDIGEDYIVTQQALIVAVYELETFAVTLDPGEGEGEQIIEWVAYGKYFILPGCEFTPPTGQEFAYWSVSTFPEEPYYPEAEVLVDQDLTITATYTTIILTITFEPGEYGVGTMEPEYIPYGTYYTLPECKFESSDPDYVFRGWKVNGTYAGTTYSWTVKKDAVLTADWLYVEKVTLSFDPNGGVGEMESVRVELYSSYQLPLCSFEPPSSSYYFDHWTTSVVAGEWQPCDSITVTDSMVIRAEWSEVPADSVRIDFDANGGRGYMAPVYRGTGTTYQLPECKFVASTEGEDFIGWEILGQIHQAGSYYYLGEDVTLRAMWGNPSFINATITCVDEYFQDIYVGLKIQGRLEVSYDDLRLRVYDDLGADYECPIDMSTARYDSYADRTIVMADASSASLDYSKGYNYQVIGTALGVENTVLDTGVVYIPAVLSGFSMDFNAVLAGGGSPMYYTVSGSSAEIIIPFMVNARSSVKYENNAFYFGYSESSNSEMQYYQIMDFGNHMCRVTLPILVGDSTITLYNVALYRNDNYGMDLPPQYVNVTSGGAQTVTFTEYSEGTIHGAYFYYDILGYRNGRQDQNYDFIALTDDIFEYQINTSSFRLDYAFYDANNSLVGKYSLPVHFDNEDQARYGVFYIKYGEIYQEDPEQTCLDEFVELVSGCTYAPVVSFHFNFGTEDTARDVIMYYMSQYFTYYE